MIRLLIEPNEGQDVELGTSHIWSSGAIVVNLELIRVGQKL